MDSCPKSMSPSAILSTYIIHTALVAGFEECLSGEKKEEGKETEFKCAGTKSECGLRLACGVTPRFYKIQYIGAFVNKWLEDSGFAAYKGK